LIEETKYKKLVKIYNDYWFFDFINEKIMITGGEGLSSFKDFRYFKLRTFDQVNPDVIQAVLDNLDDVTINKKKLKLTYLKVD